jgi:hypothetical protein
MGFNKPANPDVIATLKAAVDKMNGLPEQPEFPFAPGDIAISPNPRNLIMSTKFSGHQQEIFFATNTTS